MTSQYFIVATQSRAKSIYETMKRNGSKRKAITEDRPMLLSRRESQVVVLMGKGLSRAQISDRLGVSRKCVSVFIERARAKLRLKTSLQLRLLAVRLAISADKQTRLIRWKKPGRSVVGAFRFVAETTVSQLHPSTFPIRRDCHETQVRTPC